MKRKVLVGSLLSALMNLSVIVGGTFALFTSKSETNIAISSGKVEVVAEITDLKTYSNNIEQTNNATNTYGEFANGGNATIKNGVVNLSLITPGDRTEFTITVKNNSNVATQYRTLVQVLSGKKLFKGLEVKFDGNAYDGTTIGTNWTSAPSGDLVSTKVSIELPYNAGNQYQGLETRFAFTVETLQANGDALEAFDRAFVGSYTEMMTALNKGANIILTNDIVADDNLGAYSGVIIDTNGYTLSNSNGTLDLDIANNSITLKGVNVPLSVAGNGTLILEDAQIIATEEKMAALTLVDGFAGKIIVNGENSFTGAKNGNGILVSENTTLDLSGNGSLTTVGNARGDYVNNAPQYSSSTDATFNGTGASGIGGEGIINIHDLNSLIAEGYGKAGFGIGGTTKSVSISNTNIEFVRGGYVDLTNTLIDAKYGKSEPEGGAAIGSMSNGAVINLNNVTIKEALGGSKSAGIGARYHVGVSINITNSNIEKIVGGATAAGIGGSRIGTNNPAEQDNFITIVDSSINAIGGYYGAGIGSGYDTHCTTPDKFPITTIIIKGNSLINAIGGKYAAGIGTGYHAGGLAGEIEASVSVTATSGEKFYKATYTLAQDIGFGVIDPTRDGLNNICTLNYKGTIIGVPAVQ